jgi:hypothetical protein
MGSPDRQQDFTALKARFLGACGPALDADGHDELAVVIEQVIVVDAEIHLSTPTHFGASSLIGSSLVLTASVPRSSSSPASCACWGICSPVGPTMSAASVSPGTSVFGRCSSRSGCCWLVGFSAKGAAPVSASSCGRRRPVCEWQMNGQRACPDPYARASGHGSRRPVRRPGTCGRRRLRPESPHVTLGGDGSQQAWAPIAPRAESDARGQPPGRSHE